MADRVKKNDYPIVTVLMAAYNEKDFVEAAIQSIIDQTCTNWKLVIIDDCSSDGTEKILKHYQNIFPEKIKVYRNSSNIGLSTSLNKGMSLCNSKYIARMDADDLSYPDRLKKQIDFLENHPDIDVLGTGADLTGAGGKLQNTIYLPEKHDEIKCIALKKTMFFHPSVMIRSSFFKKVGKYNEKVPRAEDLELWVRGLWHNCKYHNLQEPLIQYTTNGYVRSYKSIFEAFYSSLFICFRYGYYIKIFNSCVGFGKSLLIKFGVYTPMAIR